MSTAPAVFAALLLGPLSLTAAGCSFSSLDPDEQVTISGRALDARGRPLVDTSVLLFKQADLGEVVFGSVLVVGSLSTVCLLPDAPALCDDARTATTDADGRYRFELEGSDTQGTLGTESTLSVVFGQESSTTVSFTVEDADVSLPDARLWNARPRVTQQGGGIEVAWSPLPRGAGDDAAYSAQLFEGRSPAPLWTEDASGGSADLDPRLLEDRSGAVAAGAGADLPDSDGADDVRASYLSRRLPVRGTAGAPPSRGRPCAAVTGTAPARDGRLSRCAATDGDLDEPARLRGRGSAVVVGTVVDLGSARPVDLVVARGFAGQVLLEVSADGRSWQTVATDSGAALAIDPPGEPTARFVRLRSPSGLDQSLAAELSVW